MKGSSERWLNDDHFLSFSVLTDTSPQRESSKTTSLLVRNHSFFMAAAAFSSVAACSAASAFATSSFQSLAHFMSTTPNPQERWGTHKKRWPFQPCPFADVIGLVRRSYGGFLKRWYPQIIHFNRVFHYKPSILWYPYFWKHRYTFWFLDRHMFVFTHVCGSMCCKNDHGVYGSESLWHSVKHPEMTMSWGMRRMSKNLQTSRGGYTAVKPTYGNGIWTRIVFPIEKWWYSIAMLVYQRVSGASLHLG